MTDADKRDFQRVYASLCAAYQKPQDKNELKVYFRVLEPLTLEAVDKAAEELGRVGTGRGMFPFAPEWYELALEIECRVEERRILDARRALPPATTESDAAERSEAARRTFVALLRSMKADGLARFFEAIPAYDQQRAAEEPQAACLECWDTGRVYASNGRWGARCVCWDTNPVLRLRRLRARKRELAITRATRAQSQAPSRRILSKMVSGG